MSFENYSFKDEAYIYDFEILDKSNNAFGITNVYKINYELEAITNEGISEQSNKNFNDGTTYERK